MSVCPPGRLSVHKEEEHTYLMGNMYQENGTALDIVERDMAEAETL
jgi:hypothetical protein